LSCPFDAARNLPECDIYVGLSGSSLRAGKKAKKRGARYVCDRGSSHIRVQDQILREKHARWVDILFAGVMSLRKGIHYLAEAFQRNEHPASAKSMAGRCLVLGHVSQSQLKDVMSPSHVMVLPSVEEGLALVQAQAMACGCRVYRGRGCDGQEGYIVPIRDAGALAERLQHLADHPEQRAEMEQRALAKVKSLGGWHQYGEKVMSIFNSLSNPLDGAGRTALG
jgi:glycosyltransferase involved in cell wall biosynthesis